MSDRRRVPRQKCSLEARIFIPRSSEPVPCLITDISSYGSFVRPSENVTIPANFDLSIGVSTLPRACRIARREADGYGIEFLDPVRHEVEEILSETAFKEELLFEALSPGLAHQVTMTQVRLRRAVDAIMDLIERRNAMGWDHTAPLPDLLDLAHQTLRDTGRVMRRASVPALPAPASADEPSRQRTAM